eukprot:gene31256-38619_t
MPHPRFSLSPLSAAVRSALMLAALGGAAPIAYATPADDAEGAAASAAAPAGPRRSVSSGRRKRRAPIVSA